MRRPHPSAAVLPSPSPPWCIGSVFPAASHSSSSSTIATTSHPLLFLELYDDARSHASHSPPRGYRCVLDTGGVESNDSASHELANPRQQVKGFAARCVEDFFPQETLIELLEEDKRTAEKWKYLTGNCLDGIQNMEGGHVQLFFPAGTTTGNLGSCIYIPNSHESVTSDQNVLEEPCIYSSSLSTCQRILQIAADKSASCGASRNIPLAVRTLYEVHCLTSQIEDDRISFSRPESQSFKYCTSHVVWNSHIPGEAAVMLENGEINIFDFKSERFHDPCFMVNMEEDFGMEVSGCADEAIAITNKKKQKLSPVDVKHSLLSRKWSCEYAWHPRNLIVAGNKKLFLVDLRQKHGSTRFCSCIADSCAPGLSSYCNQHWRNECFTSISRADYDGMYQFAAASTNHVLLYDIRQPKTPLLQWEHRMQQYPPDYLQMYCISDLCTNIRHGVDLPIMAGRVILGHSFKSGDVHAFFYGPHSYPDTSLTTLGRVKGGEQTKNLESISSVSSWQFPIKLRNPKFNYKKNIERNFETPHMHFEFFLPASNDVEPVSGTFNFASSLGGRNFTMLQLTGKGYIISQNYEISEKLDSRNLYQQATAFHQPPPVTQTGIRKFKDYKLEVLPFFLDYIRHGFLPSHIKIKSSNTESNRGAFAKYDGEEDITKKLNEIQNANNGSPNATVNNEEGFHLPQYNSFSKLDDQICPVTLPFKENGNMTLQSNELDKLVELKGRLQQWQMNFEPFLNYCKSCPSDKAG